MIIINDDDDDDVNYKMVNSFSLGMKKILSMNSWRYKLTLVQSYVFLINLHVYISKYCHFKLSSILFPTMTIVAGELFVVTMTYT